MENWKKRLGSYDSLDEAIFITIDEETIYTIDKLVDFIEQELSKAREEGYRKGAIDMFDKLEMFPIPKDYLEEFVSKLKPKEEK